MKTYVITLALLLLVNWSHAQQTERPRGQDPSPEEIIKLYYKWGEEKKEVTGAKAMMLAPPDVWFNNYTEPMAGYIVLNTGEKLSGKIIVHNRRNKASNKVMGKPLTAGGVDVMEDVKLFKDGSEVAETYSIFDIKYFGPYFKVKDWSPNKKSTTPADNFNPGYVIMSDGTKLEGLLTARSLEEPFKGLKYYNWIIYAPTENDNVVLISPAETLEAGQIVNGKSTIYTLYRNMLVDREVWVSKLESDPSYVKFEQLMPGLMEFTNGLQLDGRFSLTFLKQKNAVINVNGQKDIMYITVSDKIRSFSRTNNGQTEYYNIDKQMVTNPKTGLGQVEETVLISCSELIAKFEKKQMLTTGTLIMEDGSKLNGKIALGRRANAMKSYRTVFEVYIIPEGQNSVIKKYSPYDNIDCVLVMEEGKENKYVPVNEIFIPYDSYVKELESLKSKDEIKNLQKGYVFLKDGSKKEGRIAQKNHGFAFVTSEGKVEVYNATNQNWQYFIQQINGKERKFIPLMSGERLLGPTLDLVEVMQPTGMYCYYRNPNPTHIKKGLTNLVKGAVNVASDVGGAALAKETARQQIKSDMAGKENSLGNIAEASANAAETMEKTMEMTSGAVEFSDEGGIHYKEWIIQNNKTNEKVVVYKDNAEEELKVLLLNCDKTTQLDKKEFKKLTDLDRLDEAISFMNTCSK